jgi:hypothetical protein
MILQIMILIIWELVALILIVGIPAAILSVPLALIWTYHRRQMEELRQRRGGMIADDIKAEFAAVRSEIQALRDTALQYDLSFDNSLQQMEHRLSYLERQARVQPQEPTEQKLTIGGLG